MINDKRNYFRLEKNIKVKDDQLGGIERDRLIEHRKGLGRLKDKV